MLPRKARGGAAEDYGARVFERMQQLFGSIVPRGTDPHVRYCDIQLVCLVMVWFFVQNSGSMRIVSDPSVGALGLFNLERLSSTGSQCIGGVLGSLVVLVWPRIKRASRRFLKSRETAGTDEQPAGGASQSGALDGDALSKRTALALAAVLGVLLVACLWEITAGNLLANTTTRLLACALITVLFLDSCLTMAKRPMQTVLAVFLLVALCRIVQNLVMFPFNGGFLWNLLSLVFELALLGIYAFTVVKLPAKPDGADGGKKSAVSTSPSAASPAGAASAFATRTLDATAARSGSSADLPSSASVRAGAIPASRSAAATMPQIPIPALDQGKKADPPPSANFGASDASAAKRRLPWQFIVHVMLYYFVVGMLGNLSDHIMRPGLEVNSSYLLASGVAFLLYYVSFARTGNTADYWVRIRQIAFPVLVASCALTALVPPALLFIPFTLGQIGYRYFLLSSYVEMFSISDITTVDARQVFAVTHIVMYVGMLGGNLVGIAMHSEAFTNATTVLAMTLIQFLCLTGASCWLGSDKLAGKVWGRRIELTPKGRQDRLLSETCAAIAETYGLTAKETEILEHLVRKQTLDQIAATLVVSKNTVRTHVRNLYTKVGAHSQSDVYRLFDETKHAGK